MFVRLSGRSHVVNAFGHFRSSPREALSHDRVHLRKVLFVRANLGIKISLIAQNINKIYFIFFKC